MPPPQTFAITVPHASSQLALGRCACPDGASLTTVGSVLVDAAGTLTAQSDGAFTAQTNAAMSWLSQAKTEAHTSAGFQIYAGGGTSPGACGSGVPAASPGATKPAETAEKATNIALAAASLGRNVVDGMDADDAAGVAAQGLDAIKNVAEAFGADEVAGVFEAASGVFEGGLSGVATVAAGVTGAAGSATDIEERAVAEIKMVAGTMITASAGVGFEYKTMNKYAICAAALTSFTTNTWTAFCLLKFEAKATYRVTGKTKVINVAAASEAVMEAGASLTFESPVINYVSKLEVTENKTLDVRKKTTVRGLDVKDSKNTDLRENLTVEKNTVIYLVHTSEANVEAKDKVKVTKDMTAKKKATAPSAEIA